MLYGDEWMTTVIEEYLVKENPNYPKDIEKYVEEYGRLPEMPEKYVWAIHVNLLPDGTPYIRVYALSHKKRKIKVTIPAYAVQYLIDAARRRVPFTRINKDKVLNDLTSGNWMLLPEYVRRFIYKLVKEKLMKNVEGYKWVGPREGGWEEELEELRELKNT